MKQPEPRVRVLLDSGAYTAWRQGQAVNLDDYIRFIREVEPHVWRYVVLDVIPGRPGRRRTVADAEAAAKASYDNLQRMKDAGLRPIPVFHHGESFSWLEKMLADGEDTIGVSTAKNLPHPVQRRWLAQFFARVTDRTGAALVRVHGFGSADVRLLRRYPFCSVDSAGWAIAGGHGKLYVPPYRGGKPYWAGDPEMITMSGRPHRSKHSEDRQLDKLHAHELNVVCRFLEEEVGASLGMIRHNAQQRLRAMVIYCTRMAKAVSPSLAFFFSTRYDRNHLQVLSEAGVTNHLLSFWDLRKRPPEVVVRYAREGMVGTGFKPRQPVMPGSSQAFRDRCAYAVAKRAYEHTQAERREERARQRIRRAD